jgi:AcrR family transcriptional regulator
MTRKNTSEQLIIVAERLFAERGIDAVSLRLIAEEAGQRNPAVVQYHFGTKDDLLLAILQFRATSMNARRIEMLNDLERVGRQRDVRGLVEALVLPLANAQLLDSHYLRFLVNMQSYASINPPAWLKESVFGDTISRVAAHLFRVLDDFPAEIRTSRLLRAIDTIVRALAHRHQLVEWGVPHSLPDDLFVDDLIECVTSMLQAPMPEGTRARCKQHAAR